MFWKTEWPTRTCVCCIALVLTASAMAQAAKHHPANVPPGDEIEVISPNADPLDRPTVELRDGPNGQMIVDIPPTVLVHKYYYTGDRSFQAQLLPGGPTIVVVNHPKTNERCYVEVQMMPGAPRVTYTAHSIEYDFGEYGVGLLFRRITGTPVVKYRSGWRWPRKLSKAVHAQEIWEHTKSFGTRAKNTSGGAVVQVGSTVKTTVIQPIQQVVGILPLGKVLFNRDLEQQLTEKYLAHQRDHQNKHARKEAQRLDATYRTLR